MTSEPPIMKVGEEPPPMHRMNGSTPARHQDNGKAKGKPTRRGTADRFTLLNAFVDAGMVGLSRVEMGTWLVLYRDTRDGKACASMQDIATRVGCSKRAVVNAVEHLRRLGLLIRVFKGNNLRGASIYRVWPIPKPPSG